MTIALPILDEVVRDLVAIGDDDLLRSERHLGPRRENETALGTIHNIEARKAWALANMYEARGMERAIAAKFHSKTDEEQSEGTRLALRFGAMEKLARDAFWIQAKEDIGDDAWTAANGVGLRSGWMLVSIPQPHSPLSHLMEGLG